MQVRKKISLPKRRFLFLQNKLSLVSQERFPQPNLATQPNLNSNHNQALSEGVLEEALSGMSLACREEKHHLFTSVAGWQPKPNSGDKLSQETSLRGHRGG